VDAGHQDVYLIGLDLNKGNDKTVLLGNKLQYVLIAEELLNLYAALGVAFEFGDDPFVFHYFVGPGVEFFFPEWKNLGFFAEWGLGGNHRGKPYLGTFSDPTFGAGLHYYF
jgi:hypothetical protein